MTARVALVTPWYGKEQSGGAERQAREIAVRLADRGHAVEVFTTCSRSFQSNWGDNYFRVQTETDADVRVHRFPVDHRRERRFDAVNRRLLDLTAADLIPGVSPLSEEEESIFVDENINSAALLAELKRRMDNFDVVLFTPYLYGTTLNGLSEVAEKAVLVPCLHDEAYAYLSATAKVFRLARKILYLSEGEEVLAQRLYGPAIATKGVVAGSGIEIFEVATATDRAEDLPVDKPFVLVLGRRDATKNTDLAVKAFKDFRQTSADTPLKLVLAGPGPVSYDEREHGVYDLGLVEEPVKRMLLNNMSALFQPSRNESYSRAMMEAWACRKPVVVHGDCEATSIAVSHARGGFVARTSDEWRGAFRRVAAMPDDEYEELGENGHTFAKSAADWQRVIDRYEEALNLHQEDINSAPAPRVTNKVTAIHQVLPNLAYGDAVSDSALILRDFLRRHGIKSDIFVQFIDERLAQEARVFEAGLIDDGNGIIYHHSIGSALTPYVVAHTGPRVLIYHNITPPAFFDLYDRDFANLLADGLDELRKIAPKFDHAWGDSHFNVRDLANAGFNDAACLPLIIDPAKWAEPDDGDMIRALREDARKNILFVGRLAPNKCQHDLIEMTARLIRLNPDVRLCLVGGGEVDHPYVQYLERRIDELGLSDHVLISGQVSQSMLQAFYRAADIFVSMSEHEGFGVPLIEAMWFDVPVLAFKSTAIPETLGDAAVMFTSKADMDSIAGLVDVVLVDNSIRRRICTEQRRNRERFTADRLEPRYEELLREAFQ